MSTPAGSGVLENNPYQFITLNQSPRQRQSRHYLLKLRQQPKHSRMCGFGEKVDRRPLDPPPIIQLEIQNPLSNDESTFISSYLYNPYYFMYASLIAADTEEELHLLRDGKTRSTTGSIVSSLYRLKDLDNRDGAFFVFPDLSFSLFEIINTEIYYCTSICSEVFNVYPAKKFPGMEESTFLSRTFAEQGLKIRIRKELRMRKGRGKKGTVETEASPDIKKRPRKKSRRASAEGSEIGTESGGSDDGRQESAQRRKVERKERAGSSKEVATTKAPHNPQGFSGYERAYSAPAHVDQRHYSHVAHDPMYTHYAPAPGMQSKVWNAQGDPYAHNVASHYTPMMHDPNAYPVQPTAPVGPEEYAMSYEARVGYPHHYPPRDQERPMSEWHHREYPRHSYGPAPYPAGHGYDDVHSRPAPQPGDHAAGPHGGPVYYGQHPAAKHGEYKQDGAHASKYPAGYGFNAAFHVPSQHHIGEPAAAVRSTPNPQHAEYAHSVHGGDKGYPIAQHLAHPQYYAGPPAPGGPGSYGQPAGGSYPYPSGNGGGPSVQAEPQAPAPMAGGDGRPSGAHKADPGYPGYSSQQFPAYGQQPPYKLPPIHEITDRSQQSEGSLQTPAHTQLATASNAQGAQQQPQGTGQGTQGSRGDGNWM
ncbi:velvet factor-domain-containing protein [Gaertneriomyces semiglobifer]|nr:velvet factor-domain-containing protein [Gaertneriomyces semiglobifer]